MIPGSPVFDENASNILFQKFNILIMISMFSTLRSFFSSAKLVPLAYGIHKLQIASVVEDDKVSVDDISDKIQEIEDFVSSI